MANEEVKRPLWKGKAHPLTDTQPASSTYIKTQNLAGQLDAWSQSQSGLELQINIPFFKSQPFSIDFLRQEGGGLPLQPYNAPHATRSELDKNTPKLLFFRFGTLKNGNPPGNPNTAPRCGANSKRTQQPCKQPAMANGRCRLHGGKSTGPITAEGLERSQRANLKHGEYSQEAKAMRRALNEEYRLFMAVLKQVKELS